MQLLAKFEKILYMEFRATLNFCRKKLPSQKHIQPWHFQNLQDCFCPRSATCLPNDGGRGQASCQVTYK